MPKKCDVRTEILNLCYANEARIERIHDLLLCEYPDYSYLSDYLGDFFDEYTPTEFKKIFNIPDEEFSDEEIEKDFDSVGSDEYIEFLEHFNLTGFVIQYEQKIRSYDNGGSYSSSWGRVTPGIIYVDKLEDAVSKLEEIFKANIERYKK